MTAPYPTPFNLVKTAKLTYDASSMSGQRPFCFTALVAAVLSIAASPLITMTYPNGARILAEVADTPAKRASGLMFRDRLAPDRGMLFVFEEAGEWGFWMKNTKIALDILWLGPDKRIVYIEENVPGCRQDPCPEYKPNKEALYVLELPAGSVKREKLAKGMKLQFNLPKEQKR